MTKVIKILDVANSEFLRIQLASSNPAVIKRALQEICRLYRAGFRLRGDDNALEQAIVGLLHTRRYDEKIRRWSLNALARLGRAQFCLDDVLEAIREFHLDAPTAAAGIAALFSLTKQAELLLQKLDLFDRKLVSLSGLQHAPADRFEADKLSLCPERADAEHLKLALIAVGLDKAPSNLFHPKHANKEIVKVLGRHHEPVVSQYSVWAITENDDLSIDDLGIPLHAVESCPSNVRAWMFKLIAVSGDIAAKYWEHLKLASQDPEAEVRLSLAIGLKDTFFDGLEELVLDWFTSEPDEEVRKSLCDHIVKQGEKCSSYEEIALTVFEQDGASSRARDRMLACAAGTKLYGAFRRLEFDGSGDLFAKGGLTVNNNYKISGGIQGGAVSVGGNAENRGAVELVYTSQVTKAMQEELAKALALVRVTNTTAYGNEAERALLQAQADPKPSNIKNALENIKLLSDASSGLTDLGTQLAPIALAIAKLTGFV